MKQMKSENRLSKIQAACLLVVAVLIAGCSQPDRVRPAGTDVIQSFDFGQVQLLPGLMHDEFTEIKDYFMGLSNDDMLYKLRLESGMADPPGKEIGGWYELLNNGLTLNQWVSSYCRMYAITGDAACKEKAEYLLDQWWDCYLRIGRKGGDPRWINTLLDLYHICGREDALEKMDLYVDQEGSDIFTDPPDMAPPYIPYIVGDTLHGLRRFGDNSSEWYVSSWPLYRAYIETGKQVYRELAEFWEYPEWWDLFAAQPVRPFAKTPVAGINTEWVHAYSHVNSFNAAAEAYRVKGDPYYLNAMKNLYDWIQDDQTFATGGFGPEFEHLMPMDRIVQTLTTRTDHFETQCGTWAALRLSQNLITLTGEAKYGNWIERLAYNAINASIPMTPETNVMYYSNYHMNGAAKLNRPVAGTCCAGTRPLTVIQYYLNTYYHDDENIYVNLFTPSSVNWRRGKGTVKLTQHTDFPYADDTEFTISLQKPALFGIGVRIPEWLAAPAVTARVNDEIDGGKTKKGWFMVERQWNDGDKLNITLPMDFWLHVLDKSKGNPVAVMYGPLVMAFSSPDSTLRTSVDNEWWTYEGMLEENPDQHLLDEIDPGDIKNQARPAGDRLAFELDNGLLLKPFMNYQKGELYYMYLNPHR
jgi:hypothetical protein